MLDLRDYQQEAISRVIASYEKNKAGEELLVLPVAAGKTVIFSEVIHRLNKLYGLNAMVVAHTDELLDQAAEKYRQVKPDAIIGKIGSGRHEYGGEVTVASIATISRPEHIKRLKAVGYGLIIIDEAHRSGAESYKRVLEALPDSFVLKVTATPDRLDGKPIIDKPPLYSRSIIDMIGEGYLSDVRTVAIKTEVDLSEMRTSMGDFKVDELEEAIDTPYRNNRVVEAFQEHAQGRRAICFAVTVLHAQNLARAFQERHIPAACVSGETSIDERKRLYKALRTGEIQVLTNVDVLIEGFDLPLVDCVIMARPTQSRARFVQCIGRGLRLAPGKQDCIILDLTDNCLKHRLEPQSLRKVLNKNIRDDETVTEAIEREAKEDAEKEVQIRKLKERRNQDITVNILEKLDWKEGTNGKFVLEVPSNILEGIELKEDWISSSGNAKTYKPTQSFLKHRIALIPVGEGNDLMGGVGYYSVAAKLAPFYETQIWMEAGPLDWAQQFAEKKARMLLSDAKSVALVDQNAPWRSYPASDKQIDLLKRFNAKFDETTITKGEAADILDPIFEKLKAKKEAKEKREATA